MHAGLGTEKGDLNEDDLIAAHSGSAETSLASESAYISMAASKSLAVAEAAGVRQGEPGSIAYESPWQIIAEAV